MFNPHLNHPQIVTAMELCLEATRRGLRLEARGEKLAVTPGRLCSPDFASVLRRHKFEILALLEAKAAHLTPDCAPWLYVAQQIFAGEFDSPDGSTIQSLTIGLRNIKHPDCQHAIERLRLPAKRRSK